MEQAKIQRINELAKKSKTVGLTEQEKSEQKALREEYIRLFRGNLKAQLDHTIVMNPDGTSYKLSQKPGKH